MRIEPDKQPAAEPRAPSPPARDGFDIQTLEMMADEQAEAEWLRRPEAWHMH